MGFCRRIVAAAAAVLCILGWWASALGGAPFFPVVQAGEGGRGATSSPATERAETRDRKASGSGQEAQKTFSTRELFREGKYVPPKVVLDLLENPTPENARRYVLWIRERDAALARAEAVVRKVAAQDRDQRFERKIPDLRVVFFYSGTCPHCVRASRELAKLKMRFPDLRVVPVRLAGPSLFLGDVHGPQAREMANRAGVMAVPVYMIFYRGHVYRLVGERTAEELEDYVAYQVKEGGYVLGK